MTSRLHGVVFPIGLPSRRTGAGCARRARPVAAPQCRQGHDAASRLGYRCLHRSSDAADCARGSERLDLLYSRRSISRRLLEQAAELKTALGERRVVRAEGLIGFKLQGLANDPSRTQDLEPPLLPEDPYEALDDLVAVVEALCPVWPQRETLRTCGGLLL